MIKEYSQNRSNVIMNFSVKYCDTPQELLRSTGFKKVLEKYVSILKKKDTLLYNKLQLIINTNKPHTHLLELFKLLIVLEVSDIKKLNKGYEKLLKKKDVLIEFIEGFYDYWRKLERYALIQTRSDFSGIQNVNFIEANNNFANTVLSTYRTIEEKILGYEHNVYRQLTAGINCGIILSDHSAFIPKGYEKLEGILALKSLVLTPPFIIYPKRNKRKGVFKEVYSNPISELNINKSHYFCYPAKVGEYLALVYFHRDFMNHGISLANLFELAKPEEFHNAKPDIIYVFGSRVADTENRTEFYKDTENDMYVGFANNTEDMDYFGYMKKMILTLHNLKMIDKGHLPIHGAMVNVTLKNGKSANIAIIGDSGAGKSESLEAFRQLSDKYLKEIKIIFDDMGTFKIEKNKVVGYGTEIGAFVRLDDLDSGYAFKEMDRAIFMNPDKINARLLLPVAPYHEVVKGYKLDMVLYANNYEMTKDVIQKFDDVEEAKNVFVTGNRMAKGTTNEMGIVSSYFANPFGPLQRKEQTNVAINNVFDQLFKNDIFVGQLFTKLGIEGYEIKGPEQAAIKLFEWLQSK